MLVLLRSECDPETPAQLCGNRALALREVSILCVFGDKGLCQNAC